jgi:hypothetical protein
LWQKVVGVFVRFSCRFSRYTRIVVGNGWAVFLSTGRKAEKLVLIRISRKKTAPIVTADTVVMENKKELSFGLMKRSTAWKQPDYWCRFQVRSHGLVLDSVQNHVALWSKGYPVFHLSSEVIPLWWWKAVSWRLKTETCIGDYRRLDVIESLEAQSMERKPFLMIPWLFLWRLTPSKVFLTQLLHW